MRPCLRHIILLFSFLLTLPSASRGGEVKVEVSEPVLSKLLTRALQKIDPYIALDLDFRQSSGSKNETDFNQGAVFCQVQFQVAHLRFDSLESMSSQADLKPLLKVLDSISKSLSRNGVRTLAFKFGLQLALGQTDSNLEVKARVYPRSLRILAESFQDSNLNLLLNDVLRPLLLDRYSSLLLRALEQKYLTDLKVGNLLTLRASELEKNKTVNIAVDLGQLNDLNFLAFKEFATTDVELILTGQAISKTNQSQKENE